MTSSVLLSMTNRSYATPASSFVLNVPIKCFVRSIQICAMYFSPFLDTPIKPVVALGFPRFFWVVEEEEEEEDEEDEDEEDEIDEIEEEEQEEGEEIDSFSLAAASPDSKENVVLNFCVIVSELFSIHLINSSQVLATLLSLTYNSG